MRVLVLASYDSFLNVGAAIAPFFTRAGCSVAFAMAQTHRKEQISADQIAGSVPGGKVRWIDLIDESAHAALRDFDIVLSCLEGLSTRRLMHQLEGMGGNRPLIISVYPGLLLRHRFDGLSMRSASDLLWLNCPFDVASYNAMSASFGVPRDNARVFGVAPLLAPPERKTDADQGPVVFFEQAAIPKHHAERMFLAEQLVKLALRHPHLAFKVKPRSTGSDIALHRTAFPIDGLLADAAGKLGGWPVNLSLTSESAGVLLSGASHCLTICSTVSAEAIALGVPTAIIGDFGAIDEYGLSYFFGSGMVRSFAELQIPFSGRPDPDWRTEYMADPNQTIAGLVQEAMVLAREPRTKITRGLLSSEMSPELRSFLYDREGVANIIVRKHQRPKRDSAFSISALWGTVMKAWSNWRAPPPRR